MNKRDVLAEINAALRLGDRVLPPVGCVVRLHPRLRSWQRPVTIVTVDDHDYYSRQFVGVRGSGLTNTMWFWVGVVVEVVEVPEGCLPFSHWRRAPK